ncbi:hypothetical protein Q6348_08075 [Isoptericola sp. b441]|uniref:Uncharacterized protein n=1 Tax=Actinotalea lenta TaxID=3064654 RepID=A0ABT9D8D1_9CELL|nr:hypothetical protein [Isoptericola sp. b441]MDO8107152.1 hypothetical protein [Isoptericola sp. b441]
MLPVSSDVAGVALVVLLLWSVFLALRSDTRLSKRFESRIGALERSNRRAYKRIHQLEDVLRAEGVTVPPWPDPEPDEDDDEPPQRFRVRGPIFR